MRANSDASASEPIVLRWHRGTVYGGLFDPDLNWRTIEDLLGWVARGIAFIVIDHATGEDITRIFLAHWRDGRVVDPVGTRRLARALNGRAILFRLE